MEHYIEEFVGQEVTKITEKLQDIPEDGVPRYGLILSVRSKRIVNVDLTFALCDPQRGLLSLRVDGINMSISHFLQFLRQKWRRCRKPLIITQVDIHEISIATTSRFDLFAAKATITLEWENHKIVIGDGHGDTTYGLWPPWIRPRVSRQ